VENYQKREEVLLRKKRNDNLVSAVEKDLWRKKKKTYLLALSDPDVPEGGKGPQGGRLWSKKFCGTIQREKERSTPLDETLRFKRGKVFQGRPVTSTRPMQECHTLRGI